MDALVPEAADRVLPSELEEGTLVEGERRNRVAGSAPSAASRRERRRRWLDVAAASASPRRVGSVGVGVEVCGVDPHRSPRIRRCELGACRLGHPGQEGEVGEADLASIERSGTAQQPPELLTRGEGSRRSLHGHVAVVPDPVIGRDRALVLVLIGARRSLPPSSRSQLGGHAIERIRCSKVGRVNSRRRQLRASRVKSAQWWRALYAEPMAGPGELDHARQRRDLSLALRRRLTIVAGVGAAGLTVVFSLVAAATAPGRTAAATNPPAQSDPATNPQSQAPIDNQPSFAQPGFQAPAEAPQSGFGGSSHAISGGS